MKVLSCNVRGLCNDEKRLKIKKFVQNLRPDVVCLQEIKLQQANSIVIKSLWSSTDIGWSVIDSLDESGGLLVMWDECRIRVKDIIKAGTPGPF